MKKYVSETRTEVLSLTKSIKNRLEYEKSFGVDFSKSNLPSHEKIHVLDSLPQKKEDNKITRLAKLREEILKCKQCSLSDSRKNVVFGIGNPNADLMFVGEAPGYYEDQKGEPFVGKAGELLTKIINAIDFKREEVYIVNILKCRPPENRNPNDDEITLCSPFLIKQIEIIKPKIICALGTFAIQTLLKTTESIGNLRGKFYDYNGIKLIATYHPAYLLRNTQDKRKTWEDMKKIRDFLKDARIRDKMLK